MNSGLAAMVLLVSLIAGPPSKMVLDRTCGPNALYLLLKAHRIQVDYDAVRNALPVKEDGVSVNDLVLASRALGFPLEVVKAQMSNLHSARFPVLAHLNPSHGGDLVGHVILLLGREDGKLLPMIDSTMPDIRAIPQDVFQFRWSGILIQPATNLRGSILIPCIAIWTLAAAFVAGLAIWRGYTRA